MTTQILGLIFGVTSGFLGLILVKFMGFYVPMVRSNLDMEAPVSSDELLRQYTESVATEWWGLGVVFVLITLCAVSGALSWKCFFLPGA